MFAFLESKYPCRGEKLLTFEAFQCLGIIPDTVTFFALTTMRSSYFGEDLFSVKFWDENTNRGSLAIRNRARDLARESFLGELIELGYRLPLRPKHSLAIILSFHLRPIDIIH